MRNDSSESFFHPTFSFDLGRAYSLSPCPRVPRRQECRLRVILDEAPGRLGFVQGASANRRDPPDPAVRQSRREWQLRVSKNAPSLQGIGPADVV